MNIAAALSWYQEPPEGLTRCVRSLHGIADVLVAVDGAYKAFPGAETRPGSENGQIDAILTAGAQAALQRVEVKTGKRPWESEVEKRAWMMGRAAEIAGRDGYVFVIDADEYVEQAAPGWHQWLARRAESVTRVTLFDQAQGTAQLVRRFFRARDGITVKDLHYRYLTNGGRVLWGDLNEPMEPAAAHPGIVLIHDHDLRPAARNQDRISYYRLRDEQKLETPGCAYCERPAELRAAADPVLVHGGQTVDCGWVPVCRGHVRSAAAAFIRRGRKIGLGRDERELLAARTGPL